MKKSTVNAYKYNTICFECGKTISIYFTLSDFGDPPIIKKCKICDTLYWYTSEDEAYIKPLSKQIEGRTCVGCNANLNEALVATYTHLKCCSTVFSLDDNFIDSVSLDNGIIESIEVYLLY